MLVAMEPLKKYRMIPANMVNNPDTAIANKLVLITSFSMVIFYSYPFHFVDQGKVAVKV
jgi:hypothetical protein